MKTEKQQKEILELLDKHDPIFDNIIGDYITDQIVELDNRQSYLGQVEEFMKTFKQSIGQYPGEPNKDVSKEIMELRLNLILEELIELAEGCGKHVASNFSVRLLNKSEELHNKTEKKAEFEGSKLEVFDALIDLQYVLSGAVLAFGMQNQFDEGFEEVHRSNMSKACNSLEDANETVENYTEHGELCYIDDSDKDKGIWLVKRTKDQKLLKSTNYSPANLKPILNGEKHELKNS